MYSQVFPYLSSTGYRITSPTTPDYNCIAWAASEDDIWWWPDPMMVYYWPPGVAREVKLECFIQAYSTLGYNVCVSLNFEDGYEKIAIYTLNGLPTHAARQLPNGCWTSKLGRSHDIEHNHVEGLHGPDYGQFAVAMKRPLNR